MARSTDFEIIQKELDAKFRHEAIGRLLRENQGNRISREPTSLAQAVHEDSGLILDATVEALGITLAYDAIERHGALSEERQPIYVPVLFSHKNKIAREDSLFAALHGIVLSGTT